MVGVIKMPLYDYECECGKITERFGKINETNILCECGKQANRIISRPSVICDLEPYLEENICDKPIWIKSKKHRKQLMKENGVAELVGKGWI